MSDMLLDTFRPSIIFRQVYQSLLYFLPSLTSLTSSGDDHDYCEFMHDLPTAHYSKAKTESTSSSNAGTNPSDPNSNYHPTPSRVREVTVKSLSMAMGIRQPGFHLLSLLPLDFSTTSISAYDAPITIADRPCFLPNQYNVYLVGYVPVGIFTVLLIAYLTALREWEAEGGGDAGGWIGGKGVRFSGVAVAYERSPRGRHGFRRGHLATPDYDRERARSPSIDLSRLYPPSSSSSPSGRAWRGKGIGGLFGWVIWKWRVMEERVRDSGLLGRFISDLWTVAWMPLLVWWGTVVIVFWL